MFDKGTGTAIVVIPGVQGRWEWMRPALNALSRKYRTVSYSLCGDLGSGARMDPAAGFDSFLRQLDGVLDRAAIDRAVVCGVSYGGVIAVRYAACRPERVAELILVSAPGPRWKPSPRQARYADNPWLSVPAFCLTAFERLGAELRSALPQWRTRASFTSRYLASALFAPMLPHLMSARVKLQQELDLERDCARIDVPTLVVTGEASLDRVVPVESTREYLTLIRGARYAMMDGTGHLGLLTQPDRFVQIVSDSSMPAIHDLAGPAGHLEALLDEPAALPRAVAVFAHPLPTHGGTMHTKAVYQGAKGLVRAGCAVLRFNFRGVGRSAGHFDAGPGEMGDFTAAIDYVARKYPGLPIWAAGFSFGAWIALETGAMDDRVSVLIGIAPPVTKEGYDFTALRSSSKPKFFVQGEADDICPIQDMWKFYGEVHEPKELVVIDAADHLFDGHTVEVGEALEDLLGDFEDPKHA